MEDASKVGQAEPDELSHEYANNVFFGPTIWDLKLVFGELSGMKEGVDWHTSITLPWATAKLMSYYLAINLAAHELDNGIIRVPKAMLPVITSLPSDATPSLAALYKFVAEH